MATSLQKQLNFLKTQESKHDRQFKDNERPSMLFTFRVAASYNVRQIKDIALEGFISFCTKNPSFSRFRDLLFDNEAYSNLDRDKLTKADNEALSLELEEVLIALSQHLNNVDALKVLEYLLRNFDVHKFQSDFLLGVFLHFHSTAQYTKLLQNIDLSNQYKWYVNLNEPVLRGETIDRRGLVKRYLKHHPKILEDLLEINIRYFEQMSKYSDTGYDSSTGYYLSNGASGARKVEKDSPAFRFFCALYIEYFETHKGKDLPTLQKELLFRALVFVIRSNSVGLLNGCLMLCSFNLLTQNLLKNEVAVILNDLMDFATPHDEIKPFLASFLLLVVNYPQYELDLSMIRKIQASMMPKLLELKDQFSLVNVLMRFLKALGDNSAVEFTHLFNEIYPHASQLLTAVVSDDVNYNVKTVKSALIDQLVSIFIRLSDNAGFADRQALENFREAKNIIIEDIQQFLNLLIARTNSRLLSIREHEVRALKTRFKRDIESVFGNITYYGMFDVELLESGSETSTLGFKRLNQLSEDDKLRYCAYVNNLITDKPTMVKDKETLSRVLTDFLQTTTSLNLILEILQTAANLRKDKEFLHSLATLLIHKCFDSSIVIPNAAKKQLQDILKVGKDNSFLLRAFDTLILNLNENSVTYFNDIKRRLDCILNLDYETLIRLIAYFTLYDADKKLVPKAILTILDAPLKFRIQNNNFEEYSAMTAKVLDVAKLISSANVLDVAVKSAPRIVAKIVKDLVTFYYHGKPSERFSATLEELTIKAVDLITEESDIEEVVKTIDENFFTFLVSNFLLKSSGKYTASYLKFLLQLCEHARVTKSVKNWGRLSRDLVTYALVFLHEMVYSEKIDNGVAKVSLTVLKNLSIAFNEYTMRELNKKSKKANILKDIMVAIITHLHGFSDETRNALLKKMRVELGKKVESASAELVEFFGNAVKLPEGGLKAESAGYYMKCLTTASGLNLEMPYAQLSDLYAQMAINAKAVLTDYPSLDISQLVENFLVFYLKYGDYVNYFETFKNFHASVKVERLLKEIKRFISTQPDYIKIITFFYLYKLDSLLYLDDFKFDHQEVFLLVRSAFNNPKVAVTEHFVRNVSNYLLNATAEVTELGVVSLFGVLKACIVYMNANSGDKHLYVFELMRTAVTLLKRENKKYSLSVLDQNVASVQEERLNLSLSTVLNHLEERGDLNDTFVDYYRIQNKALAIDPTFFLSNDVLTHFNSYLRFAIGDIISQASESFQTNGAGAEIEGDNEEISQSTRIRTVFEYLTLFINVQGFNCFDMITSFFSHFKTEYKAYRERLTAKTIEAAVDGSGEALTYETSLETKRLEQLIMKLYSVIFDIFSNNKIKKRESKLMELVLSYLQFNEFRLASGLITYLGSRTDEHADGSHRPPANAALVVETLKTVFTDVFGLKGSFNFVFGMCYYFSANFNPLAVNEFVDLLCSIVNDVFSASASPSSPFSTTANKLIHSINSFIIANFTAPTDFDLDYVISKDITLKRKFMGNQDMLAKYTGEADLTPKLLRRRMLVLLAGLGNQIFESRLYTDDLNDQIVLRMDTESADQEFLKTNAAVFVSFVMSFKKLKEYNKASVDAGKSDAFTGKILKSIEVFKATSVRLVPVELYLIMLGEVTTQMKQNKNSEIVVYSLLSIIIEKISKVTLSKLFKQLLTKNIGALNQLVFDERNNIRSERLVQNYLILLTNLLEIAPPMIESILQDEPNILVDIFDLMQRNENAVVIVTGFVFFAKLSTYFKKQLIPLFNRLQKFFGAFVIALMGKLEITHPGLKDIKSGIQAPAVTLKDSKSYSEVLDAVLEYLYVVYVNFTNMMSPFVNQHIKFLSILNDSFELNQMPEVITSMVSSIEFRILIKELQGLVASIDVGSTGLMEIASEVACKTFEKLDYDSFVEHSTQLFQLLVSALKTCERVYSVSGETQELIWSRWIDSFLAFFLKCNEKQLKQFIGELKKHFINDKKTISVDFRRYLYFRVQNRVMETLGSMATSVYSESFDMINDVLSSVGAETPDLGKRESLEKSTDLLSLHKEVVRSLVLLTKNDESTSIDIHTFEGLSKGLIRQITEFRMIEDKQELVNYFTDQIFEALSNLMRCRNDEYQIKSVLSSFFRLLRDTRKMTRYLAVLGLKKIISNLQELFLVFVNDVTPRLSSVLEDEDPRIAQIGREIIILLQDITGENIEEHVREGRPNFEG